MSAGKLAHSAAETLLSAIGIRFDLAAPEIWASIRELQGILAEDYRQVAGLPSASMCRTLQRLIEANIRPYRHVLERRDDPRDGNSLAKLLGSHSIDIRATPYREDAGLDLWGFSYRIEAKAKFFIFLNTAHHRGAVAATLAHELGHCIHWSLVNQSASAHAMMGSSLTTHFGKASEMFADAVVALFAFPLPVLTEAPRTRHGTRDTLGKWHLDTARHALASMREPFRIDIHRSTLTPSWRIRYLASIIHFFKLRSAISMQAAL